MPEPSLNAHVPKGPDKPVAEDKPVAPETMQTEVEEQQKQVLQENDCINPPEEGAMLRQRSSSFTGSRPDREYTTQNTSVWLLNQDNCCKPGF